MLVIAGDGHLTEETGCSVSHRDELTPARLAGDTQLCMRPLQVEADKKETLSGPFYDCVKTNTVCGVSLMLSSCCFSSESFFSSASSCLSAFPCSSAVSNLKLYRLSLRFLIATAPHGGGSCK